jgi:hypothetical protein
METPEVFTQEEFDRRKKIKELQLDMEIDRTISRVEKKHKGDYDTILSPENFRKYHLAISKRSKVKDNISYEREGLPKLKGERKSSKDIEEDESPNVDKIPIEYSESELSQEIREKPKLFENEVIFTTNKDYESYSQSQLINSPEWVTRYGKLANVQKGNTRTSYAIAQLPVNTFGSIAEYGIDTMPLTNMKCKGTEVTYLSDKDLKYKNKHLISRRFLSLVLYKWSYMMGIPYLNRKDSKLSGMEIWGIPMKLKCEQDINYSYTQDFLTGEKIILMIKDMIYFTRNQKWDNIMDRIKFGKVSPQAYNLIDTIRRKKKIKIDTYLQEIKKRLYYDIQSKDFSEIWTFPKYHIEYLQGVLEELSSGNYFTDILTPVVYDLRNFPLISKDTYLKPMSDEEHKKNRDDYDLHKYLYTDERE